MIKYLLLASLPLASCAVPAYVGDNAQVQVNVYTSATPNQADP